MVAASSVLAELAHLVLKELHLMANHNFGSAGIRSLCTLKTLHCVNLTGCVSVCNEDVDLLFNNLKHLKKIYLSATAVTNERVMEMRARYGITIIKHDP